MHFAKLFEIEGGYQVLYTTNEEEDETEPVPYFMAIRFDYEGSVMEAKMGYKNSEDMEAAFAKVNQEKAESFFKNMVPNFKD